MLRKIIGKAVKQNTLMVITIVITGVLHAQSGPSWVPQGNLDGAGRIWDILEIPNSNVVLAVGNSGRIWRSIDGGHTWATANTSISAFNLFALVYDSIHDRVFTCGAMNGRDEYRTVWYSNDHGMTWHYIYHPSFLDVGDAFSCAIYDSLLFVLHGQCSGGIIYHSLVLLALDFSDQNPQNWTWYFVRYYPELYFEDNRYEGFLIKVKDDNLYVFGKAKGVNGIRIYKYNIPNVLSKMKRLGTVKEVEKSLKKYKNSGKVASTTNTK